MTPTRVLLAVTTSMTLAACGGGDGGGAAAPASPAAPAFDRTAFVDQANAACTDLNAAAPDPDMQFTGVEQFIGVAKSAATEIGKTTDRLAALSYPPNAEGAELRRILVDENTRLLGEVRSATTKLEQAVAAKDQAAAASATDAFVTAIDTAPDQSGALKAYGLSACDEAFGPEE